MPAASNTFNVINWVAMTAMDRLSGKLGFARHLNNSYEKEYAKGFKVGATVNVNLPSRMIATRGTDLNFNAQGYSQPTTSITLDMGSHVHFAATNMDLTLGTDKAKFEAENIESAVTAMAADIEAQLAQWCFHRTPWVVGALGTTPTAMTPLQTAKTILHENASFGPANLFITPAMMTNLAVSQATIYEPVKVISDAFYDLEVKRGQGFARWYEIAHLPSHTAGTWAGAVTMTASQSGSSIIVNCTTGDTFKKGDKITIAGVYAVDPVTKASTGRLRHFTILADATGASSLATLSIYPAITGPSGGALQQQQNVDALPANTAALTLWPGTSSPSGKSGKVGMIIQKDAFLFASRPLAKVEGVRQKTITDPETGVSISVSMDGDFNTLENKFRLDCLFGLGIGLADSCAVAVASST